jgi:hypothetical protein
MDNAPGPDTQRQLAADQAGPVRRSDKGDNEGGGGSAGDEEDTLAVTVCSMGAGGTFEVTVRRDENFAGRRH